MYFGKLVKSLFSRASGMAIMVRPFGDSGINDRFGLLSSVRIP